MTGSSDRHGPLLYPLGHSHSWRDAVSAQGNLAFTDA